MNITILKMEKDRTCFNCKEHNLCYKRKGVFDATDRGFNIDSKVTPGRRADIFIAVANACLQFSKPIENK